jgi:hypothetical protein
MGRWDQYGHLHTLASAWGSGSLRTVTETAGVGPALSPGRLNGPACTCAYPRCHNTPNLYKGVANRPEAAKEAVKGHHGRPD